MATDRFHNPDPSSPVAVGARIREYRESMGLSIRALAELCGVTHPAIKHIESGMNLPSGPTLLGLVRATGMSPNEILGWEPVDSPTVLRSAGQLDPSTKEDDDR